MRRTALVTGASSGLGAEFVRTLAAEDHDIVLVARRAAAMESLAAEVEERHGVEATVIPMDLARPNAADEVVERLGEVAVDVLVNNAGFNLFGPFVELSEREMVEQLNVNVVTLTQLTRLLLPGMLERRRGIVVNMASNAAFQPGPLMASYYASKAFVLNFSLALTEEVRGSGVTVTALCPGPTATGFQERASMEDSKLVAGRKLPSAAEVVAWGWAEAKRGRPMAVHSARWRTVAFATRFMPRSTLARMAMKAQERRRGLIELPGSIAERFRDPLQRC